MDLRGNRILRKIKISDMLSKFILPMLFLCLSCKQKILTADIKNENLYDDTAYDNPYDAISKIPLPAGFKRVIYSPGSFSDWLRNVKLKKSKTVYKFDGTPKHNQSAQFAVLNISVGYRDLQQCADAIIRLRAEFFYDNKMFSQIIFTDNNGKSYHYQPPYTRNHFDNYLQQVFGMCGTASLSKQLKQHIELKHIEPGDVLIRGGFPDMLLL
jgi:hypothetical protein